MINRLFIRLQLYVSWVPFPPAQVCRWTTDSIQIKCHGLTNGLVCLNAGSRFLRCLSLTGNLSPMKYICRGDWMFRSCHIRTQQLVGNKSTKVLTRLNGGQLWPGQMQVAYGFNGWSPSKMLLKIHSRIHWKTFLGNLSSIPIIIS